MRRKLLLLFLLSTSMVGYCTVYTITTTIKNGKFAFSDDNITISTTDQVRFDLQGAVMHNALEVSQATYAANGTTPLGGGFFVGDNGNVLLQAFGVPGTHYYVCTHHVGDGNEMKGTITVTALGVNDYQLAKNFTVFPNPATEFVSIKSDESVFDLPYNIIDQGGRVVSKGELNEITTLVDVSQLTSGVYFLQITDNRRQTLKLIKN